VTLERAPIAAVDPHPRRRLRVLGTEISYTDAGQGPAVVFLHGNPTSSYLWRNVITHVRPRARCLAPDLVGMGDSGDAPDRSYRLFDHQRYIESWFDALRLQDVVLVVHDWGGPIGIAWAQRHQQRVRGICYLETLLRPLAWAEWPESGRRVFQAMRSNAGAELVLEKNVFVEKILPASVMRPLSEGEMAAYRRPFLLPGESRLPVLQWPREIPLDGEPADVAEALSALASWMTQTPIPKLFINVDPGFLTPPQLEFCRRFRNQREVTVRGIHFAQEDSPDEIGTAVADFVEQVQG
jgi:haloalkane dehalogenase